MKIPVWREASPLDLVGKTIANVEHYVAVHRDSQIEGQPEADDEADAWKITFTDGAIRIIQASYDDSAVHWREIE